MNTRQIKYRMAAIGNTKQITRAMEAVAATKMRRAQEVAIRGRAYAEAALSILRELPERRQQLHPLLVQRGGPKALYILVGSDKGLCGAYNSNLIKVFNEHAAHAGGEILALPIGRRMNQFTHRRGLSVLPLAVPLKAPLAERVKFIDAVAQAFMAGEYDKVFLGFTHFRTTLKQEAVVRQLLPFTRETLQALVAGILPERGRFAPLRVQEAAVPAPDQPFVYEFEPGPAAVLGEVLRALLRVAAYHAFTEAEASEESARMVAMKNASENAATLLETLTLSFNKARQTAITREVAEITSGKEALETP